MAASKLTSPRLAELFSLEGLIVREDLQQDKRSALLAAVSLLEEHNVPYVVVGGIALQLYSVQVRATVDVDVVADRAAFDVLKEAEPWSKYGFELVFDRRRFIKLRHVESNVELDVNVDMRFAPLLSDLQTELVEGRPVKFCSSLSLAMTKLRTQRTDWPRDLAKRSQDRADLVQLLRGDPGLIAALRSHPTVNDEMKSILAEIEAGLSEGPSEDFPPEDWD
jgi:hypothetical protein